MSTFTQLNWHLMSPIFQKRLMGCTLHKTNWGKLKMWESTINWTWGWFKSESSCKRPLIALLTAQIWRFVGSIKILDSSSSDNNWICRMSKTHVLEHNSHDDTITDIYGPSLTMLSKKAPWHTAHKLRNSIWGGAVNVNAITALWFVRGYFCYPFRVFQMILLKCMFFIILSTFTQLNWPLMSSRLSEKVNGVYFTQYTLR